MKKPEYLMLIAIWQLFTAFTALLGMLAFLFIVVMLMLGLSGTWNMHPVNWNGFEFSHGIPVVTAVFSLVFVVLLAYFVLSLAAGIGTLQSRRWARTLGIVHAVAGIINFPVGTVIGVLIIIYLGREDVRLYFEGNL